MTQKKSQPTPTTRIRDNQRRSRARRKEYVEELEKRLRNYERYGVEANVEIQRAARQVARENVMLRELLRVKGGEEGEVEGFLRGCSSSPPQVPKMTPGYPAEPGTLGALGHHKPDTPTREGHGWPIESSKSDNMASAEQKDSNGRLSPTTSSISRQLLGLIDSHDTPTVNTHTFTVPVTETNNLCRPGPQYPRSQSHSLEDVTSCEIAANIIAGMRGHDNDEEARAELGCAPDSNCVVENMTIFQLMDR